MTRVVILSGSGRYQDRWHDFTATSVEVAKALEQLGADVAVRSCKPAGVRMVEQADLLVVNAGPGVYAEFSDGPEEEWAEAFDLLRHYHARGGPILALHAAANSLDGLDEWPRWIGGRWEGSRSMHPPLGFDPVQVSDHDHPITRGLADFSLRDERYCFLDVHEGSRILLQHRHEGRDHALVWAVDREGRRAVYDALGHDVGSYASAPRLDLLRREVGWLLGW
jgi:uncharacterized protein